jgi:putative transposase
MPGAGLSDSEEGKAPFEMPALKPYWGKPTVRNFRGDGGNGGIIRSPLSVSILLDHLRESIQETPRGEPPSTLQGESRMDEYESLSHSKWECKYHVVFIPKCRPKVLYGNLRMHLGEVFRKLAEQKESRIKEGHLLADHVHMMISIPPKYSVSSVVGFIKGKSAIHLARVYGERKQNYAGQSFWARGYFVTTVGRDEATIRDYIRNQEQEDKRLDQLNMWQ